MSGLLSIDNLDDRREIIVLLDKLRPSVRWAWLKWVAKLAKRPNGTPALEVTFTPTDRRRLQAAYAGIDSEDQYITNSTYWHAFQLATQYRLDFRKLVICLEQLVRGLIEPEDL